MDQHKMGRLAEFLQDKLHKNFLPGFYFSVEDVQDLMDEFEKLEKKSDVYYMDWRTHTIRKNLDVQWMAPEAYIEVQVDEARRGMYEYSYEAVQGVAVVQLKWLFTQEELRLSNMSFYAQEKEFLRANGFPPVAPSRRILFMCQGDFDLYLEKETSNG